VHIGVDVDRRRPGRAPIARPQDAADVDVDEDVVVPLREGARVGRTAPRGVPLVATVGGVEGLDPLEAAVPKPEQVRLRGPDGQDVGHRETGGGEPVESGDEAPLGLRSVPDLGPVQDRPELWAVAHDRGHGPAGVLHRLVGPDGVEPVARRHQDPRHVSMLSPPACSVHGGRRQRPILRV
jgi:hypothetical protein